MHTQSKLCCTPASYCCSSSQTPDVKQQRAALARCIALTACFSRASIKKGNIVSFWHQELASPSRRIQGSSNKPSDSRRESTTPDSTKHLKRAPECLEDCQRTLCRLSITPTETRYRQVPGHAGLTWSAPHCGGRWCRGAPRRALHRTVLPPAQLIPPCRQARARSPAARRPRRAAYRRAGGCHGARGTSAGSTSTTRPPRRSGRRPAPLSP